MIGLPVETRVWLASGPTDMRRGFDGLALLVQEKLKQGKRFTGTLVSQAARSACRGWGLQAQGISSSRRSLGHRLTRRPSTSASQA